MNNIIVNNVLFKKFLGTLIKLPEILFYILIIIWTRRTVLSGPFKGMRYVDASIGSTYLSKLLGTYELELHGIIEKICQGQFQNIVNVGAAEGYYSVGLAIRKTKTNIIAFEEDIDEQNLIKELAIHNGVLDRVKVFGFCNSITLKECLSVTDRICILMDVEGGETDLLDPIMIPELQRCFILVEMHYPVSDDSIGKIIRERFNNSHQITEMPFRGRRVEDFPIIFLKRFYPIIKKNIIASMDENRHVGLRWYCLEPNCGYK